MKNIKKTIAVIILVPALALLGFGIFFAVEDISTRTRYDEAVKALQAYYDGKVAAFAEENATLADDGVDVVFLGDSLTDGYDLSAYYPQFKTANRGIGGDITTGLLKRMKVSIYDVRPKVAVMLIGGNNLYEMFDDYELLLTGLKDNLPETKVVIMSLTVFGKEYKRNNEKAAFNNVKIKMLAKKYGFEYVDIYSALLDPETDEIKAEYTVEGVHLTAKGYEVWTELLTPVLTELLS